MLVIVGRGEVTAGPHGTAAVGLRLKNAVCVPGRAVLGTWCIESKLGVTIVTKSHVTAAVSCCLEMAL